jgi:hypothetical protein
MPAFTRFIYAAFGTAAIAAGIGGLIRPGLLGTEVAESGLMQHLVREEAAGFVFIGLMFFWCLRHFDARRPVHLALLTFTVIFAGIHWVSGYAWSHPQVLVVNSAPALLLAITAPWKER